jgi:hypothetical protein
MPEAPKDQSAVLIVAEFVRSHVAFQRLMDRLLSEQADQVRLAAKPPAENPAFIEYPTEPAKIAALVVENRELASKVTGLETALKNCGAALNRANDQAGKYSRAFQCSEAQLKNAGDQSARWEALYREAAQRAEKVFAILEETRAERDALRRDLDRLHASKDVPGNLETLCAMIESILYQATDHGSLSMREMSTELRSAIAQARGWAKAERPAPPCSRCQFLSAASTNYASPHGVYCEKGIRSEQCGDFSCFEPREKATTQHGGRPWSPWA